MGVRKPAKKRGASGAPWVRFIKRSLAAFIILLCIGVPCVVAYVVSNVNAVEKLVDNVGDKIQTFNSKPSQVFTADGKLLYEVKPVYRESISLSDVPEHVKNAFLAAEDKRFYSHPGVDGWGLMRASLNLVKSGGYNGGGSTITMQLAKRLFSASEVTMQRKVQDISIAIQLEKKYSKDEILQLYLNQVFFGEQAYGLAAASEIYFGKKVQDLDLPEAAMLARCVRLPSSENPVRNYQKANENKIIVLATMLEENYITQAEYEEAKRTKPKVKKRSALGGGRLYAAGYYTAMVLQELKQRGIELSQGGYTVTTTLDSNLQVQAEEAVAQQIRWNRGRGVNTAAFLAIDGEGRIVADVGGPNYKINRYSRSSQSDLQPGSSFKSFVYAEALKDQVIGEYSRISNERLTIKGYGTGGKGYTPRNSHPVYGGDYTLRTAFAQSLNIPAVRTFQQLGFKRGAEAIAEDFGFDPKEIDPVPATALGASMVKMTEMAEAYSVFMLDGKRVAPYRIKEIVGPDGAIVYSGKMTYTTTRITSEVCHVMDRILRAVIEEGTGSKAGSVADARGKTGTTNGGKSVWFCGYAKGIVGIAWAGNEWYDKKRDRWYLREMPESYGGDVCAPMWASAIQPIIDKYGSDVKPDFSMVRETEPRRKRKVRTEVPVEDNGLREDQDPVNDNGGPVTRDEDTPPPTVEPDNGDTPVEHKTSENPPVVEPEKPKQKEKRPERKKEETSNETVSVEVCADSGQLAGSYCPETVQRNFPKNKRPRGRCRVHKSPNEGGDG